MCVQVYINVDCPLAIRCHQKDILMSVAARLNDMTTEMESCVKFIVNHTYS